jgi:hypothetical protein
MVYVVVTAAAVALGLLLGGRLGALAELKLRAIWLFYAALGMQVVAFPSGVLPWSIGDVTARILWLGSYACLAGAAVLNHRLRGALVVALGMFCNIEAVVANRGHMPALPSALDGAGIHGHVHNNSIAAVDPHLPWLVDRWAAPDWVPLANVYSVGDIVIAVGAFVLVLSAMRVTAFSRARARVPARAAVCFARPARLLGALDQRLVDAITPARGSASSDPRC